MIKLDYKSDKPLNEQIVQGIKELIMCGALSKDEQLPSVRDLAVSLTVNPNTVQRAYRTLEGDGVIYSIRGKGNFVASVPDADSKTLSALYHVLEQTVRELAFYGEEKKTVDNVIQRIFEEGVTEK
ncbi:MAG: GntR family transcriptional regulator [Clostridia bacterium]|nr:GntR family transcriptional regulator [Clostridia bacterium]